MRVVCHGVGNAGCYSHRTLNVPTKSGGGGVYPIDVNVC
jgi:hypothetical protein